MLMKNRSHAAIALFAASVLVLPTSCKSRQEPLAGEILGLTLGVPIAQFAKESKCSVYGKADHMGCRDGRLEVNMNEIGGEGKATMVVTVRADKEGKVQLIALGLRCDSANDCDQFWRLMPRYLDRIYGPHTAGASGTVPVLDWKGKSAPVSMARYTSRVVLIFGNYRFVIG